MEQLEVFNFRRDDFSDLLTKATWKREYWDIVYASKYTVNHKKGGSTFVTITLENLDRFL